MRKRLFFLWWYFCPSVHLFRGGEEDVVLVGDERQPRQVERVEQGARHRGSLHRYHDFHISPEPFGKCEKLQIA